MYILSKPNSQKQYTRYATQAAIAGASLLLTLLGSVPYAAYQYQQYPQKATHRSVVQNNAQQKAHARQLKTLSTKRRHLDRLTQSLLTKEPASKSTLSWEEVIAAEGGNRPSKNTSQLARRPQPIENRIASIAFPSPANFAFVDKPLNIPTTRAMAGNLPMGWPAASGYVSSNYGWRGRRMHYGIDIAARLGAEVLAVDDGIVTISKSMRGYGKIVEVEHGGIYSTRYAHNSKNLVKVGDRVRRGQVIGLVGATGRATGTHIHFEVRQYGKPINPRQYLNVASDFRLSDNRLLSLR